MFKAETFGEAWIDIDLPFPCEIYHAAPRRRPSPQHFRVLTHYTEPRQVKLSNALVRQCHGVFDLILTNEEELLDLPNAKFAVFGSKWVKSEPAEKRFEISFLFSAGYSRQGVFHGYLDRQNIWENKGFITKPTAFYTSKLRPPASISDPNPWPYDSKDKLFESMFAVIIENDYQRNYFSEKLIDAIYTYTVPIYFGSRNIGDFFDTNGFIVVNSVEEAICVINTLTPCEYWRRMPAMAANFEKSKIYWDTVKNMRDAILACRSTMALAA